MTVLTPVFNGRSFIRRCVESVAAQGAGGSVEHLVLDAASDDGTVELLDELAHEMPHLRYASEPDRGQSHALNKGVALARGSIIGILNVDDYYEPGVLVRALELFDDAPEPSFLVGNCNMLREDGSLWFVNRPRWLRPWQLLLGIELVKFPLNPSAYFYHRSLHDLVGPYDENEHYAMDLDFILRVAFRIGLRHIDETWGNFCLSPACKTMIGGSSGLAIPQREAVYARHRMLLPGGPRHVVKGIAAVSRSKPVDITRFVVQRPDLAWGRLLVRLRNAVRRS
jgi:glycosyltransferase involved in cell wall biosynthesis